MKKTVFSLLLALLMCTAVSCSASETEDTSAPDVQETIADTADEPAAADSVAEDAGYIVELDNGTAFVMGALAEDTVAALGTPVSVTEAPSCVHEGMDQLYNFGSYTLTTSPDAEGRARIQEISLTSDAVSLADGLSIGSDKAAVEASFGTEYTDNFGVMQFSLDGADVSVVLDSDDCVSGLTITAK